MMRQWVKLMFALLAGAWFVGAGAAEPVKVVYHLNQGIDQAVAGMRNIRNHLDADPTAKIVVVTHASGIDFLLEGAARHIAKQGQFFVIHGVRSGRV